MVRPACWPMRRLQAIGRVLPVAMLVCLPVPAAMGREATTRPLVAEGANAVAGGAEHARVVARSIPASAIRVVDADDEGDSVPAGTAGQRALPRPGRPRQIGYPKALSELSSAGGVAARLHWQPTAKGGQVAGLTVRSALAQGLRLGIEVERLPARAVLRFAAGDSAEALEIAASSVLDSLRSNRDAGDVGDEASTYWSPVIEGDRITLEIELPHGVSSDDVAIALPRLSHLYALPVASPALGPGASASCEIDAMCHGEWSEEANATAKMAFVWAGVSYVCSGTLLNDTASSRTPYFLSAHHCIPNQSAASTVQTYWFYRSTYCNSGSLYQGYQIRTGGATLHYSTPETDTAFMQLREMPPAGARYAGWSVEPVAVGSPLAGVHHPQGDLQKISFAQVGDYADCSGVVAGRFECTAATPATGEYLYIRYSEGLLEPGSSGSGLFATRNGKHYLVGQLFGGDGSCSPLGSSGFAGRFDLAYNTALSGWLARPATTGRDDLVVDFGAQYGIWRWMNDTSWAALHAVTARHLATADVDADGHDDVVVDFGPQYGIWLWMNNAGWVGLHGISAREIKRADVDGNGRGDLVIDFGSPYGIWLRMNNTDWVPLHGTSAREMVRANLDGNGRDDLVVDFGPSYGIWVWMNNTNWVGLYGASATHLAAGDFDGNGIDDLVVDFGPQYGIWLRMNNAAWVGLTADSSRHLAIGDVDGNGRDDVIADLGEKLGIWVRLNNAGWLQLHAVVAQHLIAADIDGNGRSDVVVDFGGDKGGIWAYMNNATWSRINGVGAAALAAGQLDGN